MQQSSATPKNQDVYRDLIPEDCSTLYTCGALILLPIVLPQCHDFYALVRAAVKIPGGYYMHAYAHMNGSIVCNAYIANEQGTFSYLYLI